MKKRKSLTVYVSPKHQQPLSLKQASSSQAQPLPPPTASQKIKHQLQPEIATTATALSKPLLTKRRYTKHKHSQRQLGQTSVQHSQTAAASTTASPSRCSSGSVQKLKPIKRDNKKHGVQKLQQQQLQLQQQQQLAFALPVLTSTPVAATATVTSCTSSNVTATTASCSSTSTLTTSGSSVVVASPITSTVCSVGTGVDCIAGTSATSAGVAACSSAVQQLRLFRRYSYNVNVSYTECNYRVHFKLDLISYDLWIDLNTSSLLIFCIPIIQEV